MTVKNKYRSKSNKNKKGKGWMEDKEIVEVAEIVVRSFTNEECESLLDFFVKNPDSLEALQSPA